MSLRTILHRNPLYSACRRYCDMVDGENNNDFRKNGELQFLREHAPQSRVIFDVGANVGEWAQLAYRHNSRAEIHCFEPIARYYESLRQRDLGKNAVFNNAGLSSAEGQTKIYTAVYSMYQRKGLQTRWRIPVPQETERISLTTIDTYCDSHGLECIDLLKIDIEGHEYAALQGATRMLDRQAVKRIQFEYGGCNVDSRVLLKDFFELFEGRPYSLYKVMPSRLQHVPEYDVWLENFRYKNFVVLHNSVRSH